MKENKNIEDLFREQFREYKDTPSENLWNNISRKVSGLRLETIYQNAFRNFKIKPSQEITKKIFAIVGFKNFLKFSPFSLNIYYASVALISVVGVTIPTVKYFENKVESKKIVEQIQPEYIEDSLYNRPLDDIQLNTNNTIVEPKSEKLSEELVIEKNTSDKTSEISVPSNFIKLAQPQVNTTKTEITNVATINPIQTPEGVTNKNIQQQENTTADLLIVEKDTLITDISITNTEPQVAESDQFSQKQDFDNSESIQDPLDTITYDTVGYDYNNNPIVLEKSAFAVNLYFSPLFANYFSELQNSELSQSYDFYKEGLYNKISYLAGLGFSYTYKNFRVESGLAYNQISEKFQNTKTYTISTDTTNIFDLDGFLETGDTTYITYSYELANPIKIDSVLMSQNRYHRIEIPLLFAYEFESGIFSIAPKVGIVNCILLKRTGFLYNIYTSQMSEAMEISSAKYNMDLYAGLNLGFRIKTRFSVFVEPSYRLSIMNMYDSYAIKQRYNMFSVKLGVQYKF